MGDVIYLNKVRESRNKTRTIDLPNGVDPQDAELYAYFQGVLEGFKKFGYEVIDLIVVPEEGVDYE